MKKDFLSIISITTILILSIFFLTTKEVCNRPEMVNFSDTSKIKKTADLLYGFNIDSFIIKKSKVKSNQSLSTILNPYGVGSAIINNIANCSDSIFDLRKIRAGNKYTVFCSNDSIEKVQYFVYEQNAIEYIIFDLRDTINITRQKKDIQVETKTGSGIIKSSLWNAMTENNLNPILSVELSEIYAWTIDFFGLQKGDSFNIIYDEKFVDSTSIGIGKIHAISFLHTGHNYYAFPFIEDSVESYYDDEGKSLKKAFLKAPLRFSRISSRFSNSRLHPVLKIRRPHHGVDYAAPTGTPVYSVGDGKIIKKGNQKRGGGRYIKIKHNSIYTTAYMHFSKFAQNTSVGTRVKQGQVIGYVGKSGLATGPHLDFRFYKNGSPVDPLKVKSPPVKPVSKENMMEFNALKDSLILSLDLIKTK